MLKNYFVSALRNLFRQKLYAFIHVVGLALGLAAFLVISQYVAFELSYDRFHEASDRAYRIQHDTYGNGVLESRSATTFTGLAGALKETVAEVEEATSFYPTEGTVSQGDVVFNEKSILFASAAFFRVFSFPLVAGSPATALSNPNAVVLTASSARKYFGDANPVGQFLHVQQNDTGLDATALVTGVVADPPPNSHLRFALVFSMSTWWGGQQWSDPASWEYANVYTYVSLKPGASPEAVSAKLPALVERYAGGRLARTNAAAKLSLQPLTDIRLYSQLQGELGLTGIGSTVWTLMGVGVFVLILAWVNYLNLSTARSMRRAKEVSLRKIVGARRGELVAQFMLEAALVTLLALVIAFLLVALAQAYFRDLTHTPLLATVRSTPAVWLVGLAFLGVGTALTALYPAIYLSAFPPAYVLKGTWSRSGRGAVLRKSLIVFQFTASALMIAAAITVRAQMAYVHTRDLGFDITQVLVVKSPNVRPDDIAFNRRDQVFREELLRLPSVQRVTESSNIPGETIGWMTPKVRREAAGPEEARAYKTLEIGPGFLDQFGITVAAGEARGYSRVPGDVIPCLLNEAAVHALGFSSAASAVGARFVSERPQRTFVHEIQGVVRNFHQRSLHEPYEPIILRFADPLAPSESATSYALKLDTRNLPRTVASVGALYRAQFPGNAFEYFFLDDFFNAQYEEDRRFGTILSLFTLLAAFVAFLGLFGLTSFMTEQRTKEIGIRKVLGASVAGIVGLLIRDFTMLVGVGIALGLPLAYVMVQDWLDTFAFRVDIGWWFGAAPTAMVLSIALLAVVYQSVRAARVDPVKSLRHE